MSTFHDVKQGTEEWLDLRKGRVTGSKMATIMANFGKSFGEPAKKLAEEIAVERVTGIRQGSTFTNEAMERGTELEPIACEAYEMENMVKVTNGGFFSDGDIGDSPDGIVKGEKPFPIEIKCPSAPAHFKVIKNGGYDSKYKWQIQHHIKMTDADFCDFVSFHPDFPEAKRLYVFRVMRDEVMIAQMGSRLAEFERLVEENLAYLK